MNGISAIQALSPAETWEAWQALMQAAMGEADAARPVTHADLHADLQTQPAAAAMEAQIPAEVPTALAMPPVSAAHEAPQMALQSPLQTPSAALLGDAPAPAASRLTDASAAVLPMAPVLMTPLHLQNGPELRWRVQDAAAWRALFDAAGDDAQGSPQEDEALPAPVADALAAETLPAWAQGLLARLREAAQVPASAAALRPALQAWRVGLPVLLASPAGLASLQPSGDAGVWRCRRWPVRWRSARPATAERWWAVRLGLGPQGRPRTLRELTAGRALAPGQVSCELRLDDVAPGMAQWTEVLVQTPASASLRTLLGARPSLPWLLCSQALWPREDS